MMGIMMSDKTTDNGPPATVGQGEYVVKAGECMSSIAFKQGFFWQTLWDLSENSELQRVRKDPFVLLAGDRVHIPHIRPKMESGGTEQKHTFRRKGVPAHFTLTLLTQGNPRAD